jgi:RNA recognition motif-containing protein
MTASRLYVTNLSSSATLASVRQLFSTVGKVLGVEFVAERSRGTAPSAAYVIMASPGEAEAAINKFHGRLFQDRSVMVALAPGPQGAVAEARKPKPVATGVSISQQYRDRHGMVYELDCAGVQLTLRFFFQEDETAARRVEAASSQRKELVAQATGATRELALHAVAEAWSSLAVDPPAPEVDWTEIAGALRLVRAI